MVCHISCACSDTSHTYLSLYGRFIAHYMPNTRLQAEIARYVMYWDGMRLLRVRGGFHVHVHVHVHVPYDVYVHACVVC